MTVQRLGRLIAAGDVDAVRTAVEASPGCSARTVERDGQGGWTPLHLAVAEGQARHRPAAGRAPAPTSTARTEHHRTPLHVALQLRPDLVPLLRELGAQVDAPSAAYLDDVDAADPPPRRRHRRPTTGRRGVDLLSWAAFGGAAATARLLLERGADADGGALHARRAAPGWSWCGCCSTAGADVEPARPRHRAHAAARGGRAPGPAATRPRSSGCCWRPAPT